MQFLRIHGDNIIECERGLELLGQAFNCDIQRVSQNIYVPSYQLVKDGTSLYRVDLLSGHDRWGVKITDQLAAHGAPLRESTDVYFTQVFEDGTEKILLALEFCSALPAGNNAWQRSGRAATCLEVGLPYLYFAELGGVELNAERGVIAERFPNPIVPFSYISASKTLNVICLPIYQPHPAIDKDSSARYEKVYGYEGSLQVIKGSIDGSDIAIPYNSLLQKGLQLVELLASNRSSVDTLRGQQWQEYLDISDGAAKVEWLALPRNKQVVKRTTGKAVPTTTTYKALTEAINGLQPLSVGAKGVPMCVLQKERISALKTALRRIYTAASIEALASSLKEDEPLLIVWITGFKPHGDDSRPDRGLVPLARMLFGNNISLLTIIHGPAKAAAWVQVRTAPDVVRQSNGLWQAVINLSNFVLADSTTAAGGPFALINPERVTQEQAAVVFSHVAPTVAYSEHDVDTAIHSLFSRQHALNIFESLCNPPGGDWSGVSVLDYGTGDQYRWTSLARVSSNTGKRPDHVIQLAVCEQLLFLSIESKGLASSLENNIGQNLISFISALFATPPTAYKPKDGGWSAFKGSRTPLNNPSIIAGGAFCYRSSSELHTTLINKGLQFVMGFEFTKFGQKSILHFHSLPEYEFLGTLLGTVVDDFKGWFEIQIH